MEVEGLLEYWEPATPGTPSETAFCDGDSVSGTWVVIRRVGPPDPPESPNPDEHFDANARAHVMTVPQAYLWFIDHGLSPPETLRNRAETFARTWPEFQNSSETRAVLHELVSAANARNHATNIAVSPALRRHIRILIALELVCRNSQSRSLRYCPNEYVMANGVRGLISWMQPLVDRLSRSLAYAGCSIPETRYASPLAQNTFLFVSTDTGYRIRFADEEAEFESIGGFGIIRELLRKRGLPVPIRDIASTLGMDDRRSLDALRQSVGSQITRAIEKIKAKLPRLGSHLETHIHAPSGKQPAYLPNSHEPWVLERSQASDPGAPVEE